MNSSLTGVETVFLPTSPGRGFVSSSLVKEVAGFGGDVSAFVPTFVDELLRDRLGR
jgi:pantetheine-phosphate adenylyltransferase